jgi:hypothetical protein
MYTMIQQCNMYMYKIVYINVKYNMYADLWGFFVEVVGDDALVNGMITIKCSIIMPAT